MITAETITDEQICELLEELKREARCPCGCPTVKLETRDDLRACYAAIATEIVVSKWTRETARARCAELLNARRSK